MTASMAGRDSLLAALANLEQVAERFRADSIRRSAQELAARLERSQFHLVVAGQFKRGKTSLLNALVGREILPVGVLPLTSVVTMLRFGGELKAEIVFESGARLPIPVEELAAFVTESSNPKNNKRVSRALVSCPNEHLSQGLVLIDTPGIGSVYSHNTQVTYDFLPRIDGAIFVTSPEPPITEVELQLVKELKERAGRLFLVLNKSDQVEPRELAEVMDFTRRTAKEARIFAVSAKQALDAKLRDNPRLLEASGLPAFEAELLRFLVHEKSEVLLHSVARSARQQIADLRLGLSLQIQAARLPLELLETKAAELQRELRRVRQEQDDSAVLLRAALARLRSWVEVEAARFAAGEAAPLSDAVEAHWREARGLSRNQLARSLDEFLQRAIQERCDAWRSGLEAAAAEQLRRATGRFEERTNELIRLVREIAGKLFDVSVPELVSAGELVEIEASGYYTDRLIDWGLGRAPLLLPGGLFRRLLLRRLLRAAPLELERNANRVSVDLKKRLENSAVVFQQAMNRRLEETIQAIDGALASAAERRRTSAAEADPRISELGSAVQQLDRLAAELDLAGMGGAAC